MRLKVLFHDNCFDGAASAALFTRFYSTCIEKGAAEVRYQGLVHGGADVFPPGSFDGQDNAVLDFRYSPSPNLTWWFDHHVSAFVSPEDEAQFRAAQRAQHFYDPAARSCTKFMVDTVAKRYDFDPSPYGELIKWADIIDGAQFADAKTAVELREPALLLMTWVENNQDVVLKERFIADLLGSSFADLTRQPYIAGPLAELLDKHGKAIDIMRRRAVLDGDVVVYDLTDDPLESHNKFITYYLFPECRYTVGLTRSPKRLKLSIGSNPWPLRPRTHNIAKICERYGGGGHPVVGAVSLPATDIERARAIVREVVAELKT